MPHADECQLPLVKSTSRRFQTLNSDKHLSRSFATFARSSASSAFSLAMRAFRAATKSCCGGGRPMLPMGFSARCSAAAAITMAPGWLAKAMTCGWQQGYPGEEGMKQSKRTASTCATLKETDFTPSNFSHFTLAVQKQHRSTLAPQKNCELSEHVHICSVCRCFNQTAGHSQHTTV